MNKNQQHIDQLIRKKFEDFSPTPPDFIWEGIEAKLDAKTNPKFLLKSNTIVYFVISALIIFLIGWLLLGNKIISHNNKVIKQTFAGHSKQITKPENNYLNTKKNNNKVSTISSIPDNDDVLNVKTIDNKSEKEIDKKNVFNNKKLSSDKNNNTSTTLEKFKYISTKDVETIVKYDINKKQPIPSLGVLLLSDNYLQPELSPFIIPYRKNNNQNSTFTELKKPSLWRTGLFISPEFSLSVLDSLRVLHSYTINMDMQYALNTKLFIRFGPGITYASDRGFTKIEFKSWDYLGSYDDVYNVTFDTSSGVPVPTYYTHKVYVYDSIKHYNISETTNKYLYVQLPLLFGCNVKTSGKWNWYLYGGPAINAMVYQETSAPKIDKNSSVIRYETNLAKRNRLIYQFWIGAGFEYALNSKYSFTVEPNYRYYFNPVYQNFYKNQSLSAFALRIGIFIKL